jgi:hypothetical protein
MIKRWIAGVAACLAVVAGTVLGVQAPAHANYNNVFHNYNGAPPSPIGGYIRLTCNGGATHWISRGQASPCSRTASIAASSSGQGLACQVNNGPYQYFGSIAVWIANSTAQWSCWVYNY